MIASLLHCCIAGLQGPTIGELDRLAAARDVGGLSKYVENLPKPDPLDVLKTGGPYQVGGSGWHALPLTSPSGGHFVVIETRLTSEDVGEFLFARDGGRLKLMPEDDPMGVKILRHDFDLRFDVPNKAAAVTDVMQFRSEGKGELVLRFGDEYQVSLIEDSKGSKVPFAEAAGVVVAPKPAPGDATYKITYRGVVDRFQFAGSISDKEATLANEYWYPMVARQPAPYNLTVHAPAGWTIVGQGARTADSDAASEHVAKFKMDLPVVFYSISAGPYKTVSVDQDGRTYRCWSPRMTEPQMLAQAKSYEPILNFYERFAPFPFTSYGALDSPAYGGGALEAYSYATYGGGLPEEDAHEPSHTWWGGLICNTYLHSFWNESFAVFSEGLYRRECGIGNTAERRLAFSADGGVGDGYDDVACATGGPDRGGIANSIGYGKGSQVLAMLEQVMGTESMVGAMRRWIAEQPKGQAGEWEDFEKAAEKERPDLRLERFFSDWLNRPGHADFDASAAYASGSVQIKLMFKGPSFWIPLEVMLGYPDGTRKVAQLDVRDSGAFSIPSEKKPSFVSLDPYLRLIRKIANDEMPTRLSGVLTGLKKCGDPAHPDWAAAFDSPTTDSFPSDPSGALLVGSPSSSPLVARLCRLAGFEVNGDSLTYDGTTIDLNHGAAVAILDLPGGGQCAVALGKTQIPPQYGHARLVVVDDFGRVLRAKTDPKTRGHLVFRIP